MDAGRSAAGLASSSTIRGLGMTRARRLLAILAGLAMVAVVCLSQSQGDSGKNAGPVIRPVPEQNLDNELARSKFESGGIITYRTLKGENLFALQLQPKLCRSSIASATTW